jgi:dienelactone hydrolase
MAEWDKLDDFAVATFTHDGKSRPVYRAGTGPAVIVIHEAPGITPPVAAFARRVRDRGYSVVMPSLFGQPGRPITTWYTLQSTVGVCVSREITTFALDRTSPVIGWLRRLAAEEHERAGGPGVGVVGMCMTGGFALGMMVDSTVLAPVLSQPSLPFGIGKRRKAALGVSDVDLARVKERVAEGTCVLGLRFTADPFVPPARFETLRRELGDGFIAVELDSSAGNEHGFTRTHHSVLSLHYVDEPGHPTHDALQRVLTFFDDRLRLSVGQ